MSPGEAAPAGLLLAAGAGRRIGRPKALLPFHGEPLVLRGIRLLQRGGCSAVTVVVGAEAAAVRAVIGDRDVHVVENPDWRTGMGGSFRAGLAALRDAPAVVVALVDQPLVGPRAVAQLIAAWRDGARIAAATYDGRIRNPVLFSADVFGEAMRQAEGDRGARNLLRAHPEWVERVACDAVASPGDIDTVEDLRKLSLAPDPNPPEHDDRDAPKEPTWS